MSTKLNPDKALIFRILHRENVPWILDHGLHCANSVIQSPNYRTIGNPELIAKRRARAVPVAPGGTLSDYVPFYFTPYSPMMYNIKTGHGGITKIPNEDIVICVSSLRRVAELRLRYVFTDRHAYLINANFFNGLSGLEMLDWANWQARDFKKDPEDPEKVERYQAEALIYRELPLVALLGMVGYTQKVKESIDQMVAERGLTLTVRMLPGWYF